MNSFEKSAKADRENFMLEMSAILKNLYLSSMQQQLREQRLFDSLPRPRREQPQCNHPLSQPTTRKEVTSPWHQRQPQPKVVASSTENGSDCPTTTEPTATSTIHQPQHNHTPTTPPAIEEQPQLQCRHFSRHPSNRSPYLVKQPESAPRLRGRFLWKGSSFFLNTLFLNLADQIRGAGR